MSEDPEKLAEGTLISHLLELRNRLVRALVAVAIVFLPCALYAQEIFTFIARPLIAKLPENTTLIATTVVSPFLTPFKMALFVAVFAAMPYVLWQAWAFVAPGLYRHEKRFAIPLVFSSIALFYLGAAFAYWFVFPVMFGFFARATPEGVAMMTDIASYMGFVLTMFFAFGVAFEVPIAVVLLVLSGLVNLEKLKGNRGYVLIGITVVAAFLTPPDAISMCIMAAPMYLLYEVGLVMARVMARMRPAPPPEVDDQEEEAAVSGSDPR
jgi:sec-independent protein translocase protein TatC